MIWESSYWKRDLKTMATRLMKVNGLEDWTDEQYARAEKDVMIGAFICRKLGESHKFTDAYWGQLVGITMYPLKGRPPTIITNHRPEDFFDIDSPESKAVPFKTLCNQVIHSHVFGFMLEIDETPQHFVRVASDRGRRQHLIQVSLASIADLFVAGSKNYPHVIRQTAVEGKDDYKVESC